MYRIESVSGTIWNVEADRVETYSDPCVSHPCVRMFNEEGRLVFFAPFDSIIAILKQ